MRNAALQLERTPALVESVGEEGVRDALLVALNGAFVGRAVGEAYNKRGKTDILVRSEGHNVFLAECKIYAGPDGVRRAVAQLLGYTGWRDRKVGLIIFVRSTTMTTAIAATKRGLERAGIDKVEVLDEFGTEMRAEGRHPEDADLSLELWVSLVHLPVGGDQPPAEEQEAVDDSLTQLLRVQEGLPSDENILYRTRTRAVNDDADSSREGALVRIERVTDAGRASVEAFALTPEALSEYRPEGVITFDDMGTADEAEQAMRRATQDLVATEIPGARVRFDRIPPLFREAAERIASANPEHVTVRLAPKGLWQCRLKVDTDRGHIDIPMAFAAIEPPEGVDGAVRGSLHNLTLVLRLNRGGEAAIEWTLRAREAPVRERLAALNFLYAMSGRGSLEWISVDPSYPPQTLELDGFEFDEDLLKDRELFNDLVTIENFAGVRVELPDTISGQELAEIATTAELIRTGKGVVLLASVTFGIRAGSVSKGAELDIRAPIPVDVDFLGHPLRLGLGDGDVHGRVVDVEPHGSLDHVTVEPFNEEARRVAIDNLRPQGSGGGRAKGGETTTATD